MLTASFSSGLPYSSLFSVPGRDTFTATDSRYYWNKAINPTASQNLTTQENVNWLDNPDSSSWVDSEGVAEEHDSFPTRPLRKKRFAKIRETAFRILVPKSGSKKPVNVVTAQAISEERHSKGQTVLTSWRFKSKGAKTQVNKLVAVFRHRISSKCPEEQRPKTWEEYNHMYGTEQIDINDPPLPPTEPNPDNPTPYEIGMYCPPVAGDEPARQMVLNRLSVFGKGGIDSSDQANAYARARTKLAMKLEQEDTAPASLEEEWYRRSLGSTSDELESNQTDINLVPETLEQHPVFRKIVNKLCQIFGTAHSLITVLEENQQLFLAVSGDGEGRIAPRDSSMCTHTVLSGRKAFVILDASKDFRFKNGPLAVHWGARFYAGVPLLSPRFGVDRDGSSYPIGTLCIIDTKPRTEFGIEERKKLIYMSEYARVEIEKWFMKKIERKIKILWQSHKNWAGEVEQLGGSEYMPPPALVVPQTSVDEPFGSRRQQIHRRSFMTFSSNSSDTSTPPASPLKKRGSALSSRFSRSIYSETSTPPTSASSAGHHPLKPSLASLLEVPSLFDEPALKPKMQNILDWATRVVGTTLDLSLVYLLAVESHPHSADSGRTLLMSSHNLPSPAPILDAGLHLRALCSPEGGMLCQNLNPQEAQDVGLTSMLENGSETESYSSAILIAVGPHGPSTVKGFVLASFTSDPKRVFGDEDANYMRQFAKDLARFTAHLKL